MVRALAAHVPFCEAVQFGMNERRYPGQGLFIAVTPGNQKFREFMSARFIHKLDLQDQASAKSGENLSHQKVLGALFTGPQAARLHTSTAGASSLLALRARVQASRLRSQFSCEIGPPDRKQLERYSDQQ